MQQKNRERLNCKTFTLYICPNILHVDADFDADGDAWGIAIAVQHESAFLLKTVDVVSNSCKVDVDSYFITMLFTH